MFKNLFPIVCTCGAILLFFHDATAYLPVCVYHCLIYCRIRFLPTTSYQLLYFLNEIAGETCFIARTHYFCHNQSLLYDNAKVYKMLYINRRVILLVVFV